MFKRQINFEDFNILEKEITMPSTAQHRKYEALRAIIIDRENIEIVANKFGYKVDSLYTMLMDAKRSLKKIFPKNDRKKRKEKIEGGEYANVIKLRHQSSLKI